MGYRRDSEVALRWKKWRQAQDDLRVAAGLSSEVTETEEDWWDYLMHEINVPAYDYGRFYPLSPQQSALRQLVFSWPGGAETELGEAFLRLERRNEGSE
jgi:hypothetical protein